MSRTTNPIFPFAPGMTAQPSYLQDGVVFFTDIDGENVWATQELALAYGYTWDQQNQVARAFISNPNVENIGEETNNMIKGGNNEIRDGVNNTMIAGQNNLVLGLNTSDNITGDFNQMNPHVSNTILMGTKGNATVSNSFVQGGNSSQRTIDEETGLTKFNNILGQQQLTKILMSATIIRVGERDNLWLNDVEGACYPIPLDAVLMFNADIMGVVVDGGNLGEFMSFNIDGVTKKQTSTEGGTQIYSTTTIMQQSSDLRLDCQGSIYYDADGEAFLTINIDSGKVGIVQWVASIEITQLQTKGI